MPGFGNFDCIGGVDTEEYPGYLGFLGPGPDFSEQVMDFFIAKTAFHNGGPECGQSFSEAFFLFFVGALPSFWFEASSDLMFPAPSTVSVIGVDCISSELAHWAEPLAIVVETLEIYHDVAQVRANLPDIQLIN